MTRKALIVHVTLALLLLLPGCQKNPTSLEQYNKEVYKPQFASGMKILGSETDSCTLLVTQSPWQGANPKDAPMLFISRNGVPAPDGFAGQVLKDEAKRIVCMSSSHVAMLDALGVVDRVVGVSGIDFISNKYVQSHRDKIADVGYDGNIDYEKLVSFSPDLVILYGVGGASPMESKLKELNIPFVYLGEYTEESPLGKAEWLVAVGELVGKRKEAEKIFSEIVPRYNGLKELVVNAADKPKVMVNTPYQDQWLMPPTGCYAVTLIKDAGGEYLYPENTGERSVPIDMEKAWLLTNTADCWINLGQTATRADLLSQLPRFADTKPVQTGQIWNTTLRVTPAGGNDYWESGIVHPDLVLQDLIKIFHPELLADKDFTYYTRLQ